MITISIITINYNNAIGLKKTIESVISQTYKEFEYIVIDGGSSDNSVAYIEEYKKHISYYCSEKDEGIYDAMNKGIGKAKGEYLLFLNSGDFLFNNEILFNVFCNKYDSDILYGDLIFDFYTYKKTEKRPVKLTNQFLYNDTLFHPASFIKKQLFQACSNYNCNYKIASDYDFFLNAILNNKASTKYLNFVISVYDTSGISSNESNFSKLHDERKVIQKHYFKDNEIVNFELRNKFKWLAGFIIYFPFTKPFFNFLLTIYSKIRN